jgi:hypothetical protein
MTTRAICAALLLGSAVCTSPLAAQRAHFGPHVAYNFDIKETAIGAQLHMPVAYGLEFYPSFDYYLVDSGSLLGINADLKFRTPGRPLYLGGGLNILRTGGGGSSSNDTGFDVFAGLETRYAWSHPYVEFRGMFHNGNSTLQAAFGINVTLR